MLRLALAFALLTSVAHAQVRTVAKLKLDTVEVWVTRARFPDGGLTVKLIAKGVGPKPQALTIYHGGGDDDGAGDAEVKAIEASALPLPDGQQGVRVDFTFRVPDGRKNDEQTDTTLVGFQGKTHKLLELRTRLSHDRGKNCREGEETQLALDAAGNLVASTTQNAESALGDDDLPLDKTCRAPRGAAKKSFKWSGDKFVDAEAAAPEEDD